MNAPSDENIPAIAVGDLYPAVLEFFRAAPPGRILDVPAGHGAFALELLKRGYSDIDCLDINAEAFRLQDPRVRFQRHDVINPLPFPDAHFDYVFSIEGIEHFDNPVHQELCRNRAASLHQHAQHVFVDARLKYWFRLFPRFRPLMPSRTRFW